MLSIRNTFFWIFLYLLLAQFLAPVMWKSADEMGALLLLTLAGMDMVFNNRLRRYRGMFLVVGIMALYAIYSMAFMHYNTKKAILLDFVIELKPFFAFYIGYAIAPQFTHKQKQILKGICIVAVTCLLAIAPGGWRLMELCFGYPALFGSICFICFLLYMYCSVQADGTLSKRDLAICMLMLALGLCCLKSKYYGETVLALYLLFLYRPGAFRNIKPSHVFVAIVAIIIMFAASWEKISYYFLNDSYDIASYDTVETFARPALYVGMWALLMLHPIFGSGLASFATFASSPDVNYSLAYAAINLDKVFGLSEDYYSFICDAQFAYFAQFGFVGIALFIWFIAWIYRKLRLVLHSEGKLPFICGLLTIVYVIIESTSGNCFTQAGGFILMCFAGMITGRYRTLTKQDQRQLLASDYPNTPKQAITKTHKE